MSDRPVPTEADPRIAQAADCLARGGVVLLPTDTVFGLAALPARADAVARIFALKDRPAHKNLAVMVADLDQLDAIGAVIDAPVRALVASPFCPGPLTLAVGLRADRADWLAGRDELAFRIPDDAFLLALMRRTGPLMVTSANRSGLDTPVTAQAAAAQLTARPDMVIDGRACGPVPSTLVNCRRNPPVIERHGAVPPEALAAYLT